MKRARSRSAAAWLIAAIAVLWAGPASARHETYEALVIDAASGQVLQAYNADALTYPASLTKMMTLYLTFDALRQGRVKLNQRLAVSQYAAEQEPTKLDLVPGDAITVEEAVLGLVVKSANDAAVVLAEALGGNESSFAELMTRKAAELGMRATRFRNASGLPNPGQVTTARDMATLARALIRDFPQYYHYFSTREFTFQGLTIPTHNHVLVNYAGADGLKTGYIHASGYNLVTSAVHNGRRLIGVVLGGRTGGERDRTMMRLLDRGFATRPVIREASNTLPAQAVPVQAIAVAAPAAAAPAVAPAPAAAAAPVPAAVPVPAAEPAAAAAAVSAADPARQFLPAGPIVAVTTAPLDDGSGQGDRSEAPIVHPRTAPALAMVESDDANEVHAVHTNRWGIQVGAYAHHAQAQAAALRIKRATVGLRRATISIAESRAGRSTVYRARLLGLSAGEARAVCSKIHRKRGECVILNPGNERALAALRQ